MVVSQEYGWHPATLIHFCELNKKSQCTQLLKLSTIKVEDNGNKSAMTWKLKGY